MGTGGGWRPVPRPVAASTATYLSSRGMTLRFEGSHRYGPPGRWPVTGPPFTNPDLTEPHLSDSLPTGSATSGRQSNRDRRWSGPCGAPARQVPSVPAPAVADRRHQAVACSTDTSLRRRAPAWCSGREEASRWPCPAAPIGRLPPCRPGRDGSRFGSRSDHTEAGASNRRPAAPERAAAAPAPSIRVPMRRVAALAIALACLFTIGADGLAGTDVQAASRVVRVPGSIDHPGTPRCLVAAAEVHRSRP